MSWRAYVRRNLSLLDLSPTREREIVDEVALQLEAAYDSAIARGLPPEDARLAAEAEVPDWRTFAESVTAIERTAVPPRDVTGSPSGGGVMTGAVQDLRHAVRTLLRMPGYSFTAFSTLALGLALGTATFSILNGVLVAPLPFANASRLAIFHATVPPEGRETPELAYLDALSLAEESSVFADVAAVITFGGATTIVDPPVRIEGLQVSPRFFTALGSVPALGRPFLDGDGEPGADRVAILGYGFWQRLGAPSDIVGRPIVIDEVPRTIVGVGPRGFHFDLTTAAIDVFVPLTREHPFAQSRGIRTFRVITRLPDDVDLERANAAARTIGDRLARAFADTNRGRSFSVHSLKEEIAGPARPVLGLVAALVGLILLVAGLNLASLMLARALARARETTVRLALGASRWRVVRESLAESSVLALAGGVAALPLAKASIDALRAAPGAVVPRLGDVTIDWRALLVLAGLAGAMLAVAAVVPATLTRYLHALSALRTGQETAGRFSSRFRATLVAVQMGMAFVLLGTAALLGVSLHNALAQRLGFEVDNVATMRMAVPAARYSSREQTAAFYGELLQALRAQGAVKAAGLVSLLPLAGNTGSTLTIQGREDVPLALRPTIGWHWASPGYFGAIGIPIVRGRDFNDADVQRAPHVTIINETLARQYFPGEDPIGKRVYYGGFPGASPTEWHEVIAVVGDVRHRSLEAPPDARAYDLFGQHWGRSVTLVIRTPDNALQAAGLVRSLLASRDPALAVFAIRTMDEVVATSVARRRLLLWLVGGFAGIGLFVVLVGLYGTVSYMVTRRTREMGIRIALGATDRSIRSLILRHGLRLALAGIAMGSIGALALKPVIETQLFGVTAASPAVLLSTAIGVIACALAACVLPAERALQTDAARSLRCD